MFDKTKQTATSATQLDNASVVVTHWRFKPGEATGWHRHAYPYVVVPLMDGRLRIVDREGTREVAMTVGASYYRPTGIEHDVINAGPSDYAFIEIELKSA